MHLARQCFLRGDCEQRLRRLERAPGRGRVARLLLIGHGIERERQSLARHFHVGGGAHGLRQHRRCRLGHSELLEGDAQRQRHLRHGGVEPVALAGERERGGTEEVAVIGEVFFLATGLTPRQRPQLCEQVDAPVDGRLLRHRLERRCELGPLRSEQLPRLRAVERPKGPCRVGIPKVEGGQHERSGLDRAPGLRPLVARRLHACLAKLVAQDHRAPDPLRRRLGRVGQCRVAGLE